MPRKCSRRGPFIVVVALFCGSPTRRHSQKMPFHRILQRYCFQHHGCIYASFESRTSFRNLLGLSPGRQQGGHRKTSRRRSVAGGLSVQDSSRRRAESSKRVLHSSFRLPLQCVRRYHWNPPPDHVDERPRVGTNSTDVRSHKRRRRLQLSKRQDQRQCN